MTKKTTEIELSNTNNASSILLWILIAIGIGMAMGWVRYWIGYYILFYGIISAILITWTIHKTSERRQQLLPKAQFTLSMVLFFSFMIGQAIGFGLAQAWFDPIGWLMRVLEGQTSEAVFGIFSTAGVSHQFYSGGFSSGFWIFLSLFDLAFMFFFILITLIPKQAKK